MPLLSRLGGVPDKSLGLTAAAGDILSGKTAAVNGAVVTGTLAAASITPLNLDISADYNSYADTGVQVTSTTQYIIIIYPLESPDVLSVFTLENNTIYKMCGTGYLFPEIISTTLKIKQTYYPGVRHIVCAIWTIAK